MAVSITIASLVACFIGVCGGGNAPSIFLSERVARRHQGERAIQILPPHIM